MRWMMVAAFVLAASTSLARPATAGQMTYLSLGDSIAFGETDFAHNPSAGDRGYVKPYAQFLGTLNGGVVPKVINLAIDGDTSTSLFTGSGRVPPAAGISDATLASFNTHYTDTSVPQNVRMIQAIGSELAKGDTISNVTVSLGANDLFALANKPGFLAASPADQQAMLGQALGTLAANYGALLNEVKAILPNAKIAVLGEYNPFPATPSSPFAAFAAPAIQGLNATIQGLAKQYGASYVDTYTPFVGHEADYTHIVDIPGDVHPNAAGYSVIATQIEAAATPEPSTIAILGVGLAALAARARRKA